MKKIYLFELAKLGGILFFFFISTFALLINPYVETSANDILSSKLRQYTAGYLAITILYLIFYYFDKRSLLTRKLFIGLLLPICYIVALFWVTSNTYIYWLLNSEPLSFSSIFFIKAFSYLSIVIAFTGMYYLINYWLNLKKQKEISMQATNLANEAQLQMLRYQINPHFLFNALNTIRSMVEEDKTVARNMITELSSFFRYSLTQDGNTDTLENEINAIKNYLEIQKIRFEEKLNIEYDIDERLYKMKIPFYIILPLVENAIKYGLQSSTTPLNIKILAKANSHLEISVYNTGHIVKCEKSKEATKTGIENTKKRLSLFFPDNYSFDLLEEDGWVISKIIIKDYKNIIAE